VLTLKILCAVDSRSGSFLAVPFFIEAQGNIMQLAVKIVDLLDLPNNFRISRVGFQVKAAQGLMKPPDYEMRVRVELFEPPQSAMPK
jgi:hypothetical protein